MRQKLAEHDGVQLFCVRKEMTILSRSLSLLCLALIGLLLAQPRPAAAKTIYGTETSEAASLRDEDSVSADEGINH